MMVPFYASKFRREQPGRTKIQVRERQEKTIEQRRRFFFWRY